MKVSSKLRSPNLKLEAGLGLWDGFTAALKFGRNTDIDTAAEEDIWSNGGSLSSLSSAETMDIVSSSAQDASGGTGCQTIIITGLDSDYLEVSETVTLNGTTDVETTQQFLRVEKMYILGCGSSEANVGIITATASSASSVQAAIPATEGHTLQAISCIPAKKTGALYRVYASLEAGGSTDCVLRLRTRDNTVENAGWVTRYVFEMSGIGSSVDRELPLPLKLGEKTDVKLTATTTTNNTVVSGGFDLLLADNA